MAHILGCAIECRAEREVGTVPIAMRSDRHAAAAEGLRATAEASRGEGRFVVTTTGPRVGQRGIAPIRASPKQASTATIPPTTGEATPTPSRDTRLMPTSGARENGRYRCSCS